MGEYAYKMFNKELKCRGFQFEPGKWYEEADKEANCAGNGFHAAKNPLDCLSYYPDFKNSQCWLVEIGGDIDEDNLDSKVSAQKIRLVGRLDLGAFVASACCHIIEHPEMRYNRNVALGPAVPNGNHFAICVCENPKAKGEVGDVLGILRTYPGSREIAESTCFEVDGKEFKAGVWYDAGGKEVT